MYVLFGGPAMARLFIEVQLLHLYCVLMNMLLFHRQSMFHWLKHTFKWGMHDIKYLVSFPLDLFGFKVKNPPQDFISGGEKLNSLMQIFTFFMFVSSGIVMWVPQYFPGWVIDWGLIECIILP